MNKGVIVNFFSIFMIKILYHIKDKILQVETITQHKTIYHVLFPDFLISYKTLTH